MRQCRILLLLLPLLCLAACSLIPPGQEPIPPPPVAPPVPNQAPIALFSISNARPPTCEVVTLDASASRDLDGEIISYHWLFCQSQVCYAQTEGETIFWQFTTEGRHQIRLTVVDDHGATGCTDYEITAYNPKCGCPGCPGRCPSLSIDSKAP